MVYRTQHMAEPSSSTPAFEALPQRDSVRRKRHKPEPVAAAAADQVHVSTSGQEQPSKEVAAVQYHPIHQPEYRSDAVEGQSFEYLDHTADVQLHAWGPTLEKAFENTGLAMYNYMTPVSALQMDEALTRTFEAEGHDLQSLLFAFLDELLFVFSTELLVCKELRVTKLDREAWKITAIGRGEKFDRSRHEIGTEIKAITYSAMQIREEPGDAEVFVIVDI